MADLATMLKSDAPLEDVAGAILEELVKSHKGKEHVGNFAGRFIVGLSGQAVERVKNAIFEAFQWLQSHGMLALTDQAGWYLVTKQGQEIGNAANLKVHLGKEQSRAEATYESTVKEIAGMRERAESEIQKAIEDTGQKAQTILNLARETAQRVSLDDVQKQFDDAAKHCLFGIKIWASLSMCSVILFVIVVIGFFTWEPSFQTTVQNGASQTALNERSLAYSFAIYHTVLRVTILTAIAAIATFCLKVLRAQLHLREQNLHRRRVANSMSAFLGATTSPEQRDVILIRLADAITAFGTSGLLSDDDSMSPAKVILESVQRGISSRAGP